MEKEFISEEDKAVLRKLSKYLKSYNVRSGMIQVESDFYNHGSDVMKNFPNFSNNWNIEIPHFAVPYLGEIIEKTLENVEDLDIESVNYDNIEFDVDAVNQELTITRYYGYEEPGDGSGMTWGDDTDDTEMVEELMKEILESGARPNDSGFLQLDYNGSGDSGYLESNFTNGDRVPANIENWCYDRLESNYGGWEINEGSQGYFLFNVENRTIELEHTNNVLTEEVKDILTISFGK